MNIYLISIIDLKTNKPIEFTSCTAEDIEDLQKKVSKYLDIYYKNRTLKWSYALQIFNNIEGTNLQELKLQRKG